jgi:methionyl-tRNA formyltransferase
MRVLFCAHREWGLRVLERVRARGGHQFIHISDPSELTAARVRRTRARIAFFADWSWKVPPVILGAVECVGFHAAPLPSFRGGSPIQNQIARGIKTTTVTAFRMTEDLDAGDILLEAPLSLAGTLGQIFGRIERIEARMIGRILAGDYTARQQSGPARVYRRRRLEESEISDFGLPLEKIYDQIRMLADPYPNAFVRIGDKRIVFSDARFDGKRIAIKGEIVCESS